MKKWLNKQTVISFILGAILFSGVGVGAASYFQFSLSQYTLYVDGAKVDKSLYMYQGANYLPLGEVAKALDLNTSVTGKRIDLTTKLTDVEEVAKNAESCVLIRVYSTTDPATAQLVAIGSGVVISDGVIVTNKHVLDYGKMFGIQYNDTPYGGEYITAERYSVSTDLDIGFIKSPMNIDTIKIGNSDKVTIGQEVIAIGSPGGLKNQISEGKITGLSDDESGKTIQVNSNIKDGSSGGGLFNMQGELIGIVKSSLTENEAYSFVIPINSIKPFIDKLK